MKTMCRRLFAAVLAAVLVLTVLPVTSVEAAAKPKLSKTAMTLNKCEKTALTVKNVPKKAKLTWKSSKKSVATVSKKGVVKAKKAGSAKIICKVVSGKKTYTLTCKVQVTVGIDVGSATDEEYSEWADEYVQNQMNKAADAANDFINWYIGKYGEDPGYVDYGSSMDDIWVCTSDGTTYWLNDDGTFSKE